MWWAALEPRSGSEQRGRRPVVVISHDAFNRTEAWRSVIVVPLSTSAAQSRRGPTAVVLPRGSVGLPRQSTALCHQVTTLDRAKLGQAVGTVAPALLIEIVAGLKAAMDLP